MLKKITTSQLADLTNGAIRIYQRNNGKIIINDNIIIDPNDGIVINVRTTMRVTTDGLRPHCESVLNGFIIKEQIDDHPTIYRSIDGFTFDPTNTVVARFERECGTPRYVCDTTDCEVIMKWLTRECSIVEVLQ